MERKNLREEFQSKRNSYVTKLSNLEKQNYENEESFSNLSLEKEKLEKGKALLDVLSGLITDRSKKADEIFKLINTGKDASSKIKDVNDINVKIKENQNLLKSLNVSEGVSFCLADIIGEDMSHDKISRALEYISRELNEIKISIQEKEKKDEENNYLKEKYKQRIAYIDRYLNGLNFENKDFNNKEILESDLVYKYAKTEGMDDVMKKMEERTLTYEEYEEILKKIDPVYAYVVSLINTTISNSPEHGKYYGMLADIEKGTMSQKDRKKLEDEYKKRFIYENNLRDLLNQDEKVEDSSKKVDIDEIIKEIPWKITGNNDMSQTDKQKEIIRIVGLVEGEKNLRLLAEALKEKEWGLVVEKQDKFSFLREEKINKDIEKDTGGVFKTQEDYDEFKSKDNHNSTEAIKLIKSGNIEFLISHLAYFKGLNEEVFSKLLEKNGSNFVDKVLRNYKSFGLDIDTILIKFLDYGYKFLLLDSFFYLKGKTKYGCELACKLIEKGYFEKLIDLLKNKKFEKLDSSVANLIIDIVAYNGKDGKQHKGIHYLATHLQYFTNLDGNIKSKIMDTDDARHIDENTDSFVSNADEIKNYTTDDYIKIIENYKDRGLKKSLNNVIKNLGQIEGLDYKKILDKLLEERLGEIIINNLGSFKGIGQDYIIDCLFNISLGGLIPENLYKFEGINHVDLANKLIDDNLGDKVAEYLDNFEGLDHNDVAKKIDEKGGIRYIYYNLDKFNELNIDLIDKLILCGKFINKGGWIVTNISNFKDECHRDIAYKLIDNGESKYVARSILKFKGLNKEDIAKEIIKKGGGDYVIMYFKNFELGGEATENVVREIMGKKNRFYSSVINNSKILDDLPTKAKELIKEELDKIKGDQNEKTKNLYELIEKGEGAYVARNIQKYKEINYRGVAYKLIDNGEGEYVIRYFRGLEGIDFLDIAKKIIERGEYESIINNFMRFEGLDLDIAKSLMDNGEYWKIVENLKCFDGVYHQEIAEQLIERGYGDYVSLNLSSFELVDQIVIVNKLIDKGCGESVVMNLSSFEGLDHKEIARKIIKRGEYDYLVNNLRNFKGLDREVADDLKNCGYGGYVVIFLKSFNLDTEYKNEIIRYLIENGEFENAIKISVSKGGLDRFVTKYLINNGNVEYLEKYPECFKGLDLDIAKSLIKNGEGGKIAANIKNFEGKYHGEIIKELMNGGEKEFVDKYLKNFKGLNKDIAQQIIDKGYWKSVANNIEIFEGLDQSIAQQIIDKGYWKSVANHLKCFEGLDQSIAQQIIDKGYWKSVANNIEYFKGLNQSIAQQIIDRGYWKCIANHLECFKGLDYRIADSLIEKKEALQIVKNIKCFNKEDHTIIAYSLILKGEGELVIVYFDKFFNLNYKTVKERLDKTGNIVLLNKYRYIFNERGESEFADDIRNFLADYVSLDKNYFDDKEIWNSLYKEFKEKTGKNIFPKTWSELIKILGGKPGLKTKEYFDELLKSKEAGDEYYEKYMISKIKIDKRKELFDILSQGDTGEVKIEDKIKKELSNWGIDEVFINLINSDNEGVIEKKQVEEAYSKYIEKGGDESISLEYICEILKSSDVVITGNEDSYENREEEKEYSPANLGLIEKYLGFYKEMRNSFKELIEKDGSIDKDRFDRWSENYKFAVTTQFDKVLFHFGLRIVDENNEFDYSFETPEEFTNKMKELKFTFKNEINFIKNLKKAFKSDPSIKDRLSDVIKRLYEYSRNKKGVQNPIEHVESHNGNDDFSAIKFSTERNAPRIILELNSNVILTIVKHEDYDGIKGKQGSSYKVILKNIENRKFW